MKVHTSISTGLAVQQIKDAAVQFTYYCSTKPLKGDHYFIWIVVSGMRNKYNNLSSDHTWRSSEFLMRGCASSSTCIHFCVAHFSSPLSGRCHCSTSRPCTLHTRWGEPPWWSSSTSYKPPKSCLSKLPGQKAHPPEQCRQVCKPSLIATDPPVSYVWEDLK